MKYIYISRSFNVIGYSILKYLIDKKFNKPELVIISKKNIPDNYKSELSYLSHIDRYLNRAKSQDFEPIKFTNSIHKLCINNNIKFIYANSINSGNVFKIIKNIQPETIFIGGGFHEKLNNKIIEIPPKGLINSHPSKLPLYRGTDVHRWQILNCEDSSGLTLHYVNQKFDSGNIISSETIKIGRNDTPQKLIFNISKISGELALQTLKKLKKSKHILKGRKQNNLSNKHYFSKWPWHQKKFLKINWLDSARYINALVKSCNQEDYKYNGPYFIYKKKYYFVRESKLIKNKIKIVHGKILKYSKNGILIKCGDTENCLQIKKIQPFYIKDWNKNNNFKKSITLDIHNSKNFFNIEDRLY